MSTQSITTVVSDDLLKRAGIYARHLGCDSINAFHLFLALLDLSIDPNDSSFSAPRGWNSIACKYLDQMSERDTEGDPLPFSETGFPSINVYHRLRSFYPRLSIENALLYTLATCENQDIDAQISGTDTSVRKVLEHWLGSVIQVSVSVNILDLGIEIGTFLSRAEATDLIWPQIADNRFSPTAVFNCLIQCATYCPEYHGEVLANVNLADAAILGATFYSAWLINPESNNVSTLLLRRQPVGNSVNVLKGFLTLHQT